MNPKPRAVSTGSASTASVKLDVRGRTPVHHIELTLREGAVTRIGRAPQNGTVIPGDISISREHADFRWQDGRLYVTCLPSARNPILLEENETSREGIFVPGDRFRIGMTTFEIGMPDRTGGFIEDTEEFSAVDSRPSQFRLRSFSANDLREVGFRHADEQLELLAQLPELISESQSDTELGQTLCRLLMDAMPHAKAVAVAHYDLETLPDLDNIDTEFPKPVTMRVQTREEYRSAFQPSRNIILKTLRSQESLLHIWNAEAPSGKFTMTEGLEWAVCAPIRGEGCAGWCMYVSGEGARSGRPYVATEELAADLRFTELVARFIGSVRQVRTLQDQRSKLNAFFSPKVIDGLASGSGTDVLEPAERNITVLFCDVRGFSRKAERLQNDLFSLLQSVRAALGVMVDGILERDGAIADFQGDAAMGFWGWPVALDYGPIAACRAALSIQNEFQQQSGQRGSLLEGFSVGIGIAHGRAIAGQIGTEQQSKIGVFGPVVNQCARLESMTKQFGVSICIDSATAEFVDRYFSADDGRIRPLARVRPLGLNNAVDVFNLLPSEKMCPEVQGQTIANHTLAHEAIIDGRWNDADRALSQIPDADGPKQFLLERLGEVRDTSPEQWDGVIPLAVK